MCVWSVWGDLISSWVSVLSNRTSASLLAPDSLSRPRTLGQERFGSRPIAPKVHPHLLGHGTISIKFEWLDEAKMSLSTNHKCNLGAQLGAIQEMSLAPLNAGRPDQPARNKPTNTKALRPAQKMVCNTTPDQKPVLYQPQYTHSIATG